ncbi:hypothetical protein KPL70_023135 [Citrus sinensis]|nr:hypothetical protein KPL70_023135 [Citrus sinensis]
MDAFAALKQAMVQAPVLKLLDFTSDFVIETDASNVVIGAVLTQQGHPIAYFSKKLGPKLRAFSTYIKELHAIVDVVYKWREYLLGRFFVIRTDHKSRTNSAADALSRVHEIALADNINTFPTCLSFNSQPSFELLQSLLNENTTLPDLISLHQQLLKGELSADFSVQNGFLLHRQRYYISPTSSLKAILLQEFHSMPLAGHVGVTRTLISLSSTFYWPKMRHDVEKFIRECLICQQTKYSTQASAGLLQPLPIPSMVWDEVTMDFITGLPLSKGFSVILVVVDRLTKFAHFGPLPCQFIALKTAELFVDMVIKIHGFPSSIIYDRDPVFLSNFWKQLFLLSGTTLHHSTAYNPQTDGQTEVMSPYHALFGRLPPTIPHYAKGSTSIQALEDILLELSTLFHSLKDNLNQAQHRMAQKANAHHCEAHFEVGDKVLVKLHPYRQNTLASRGCQKLAKRYYGPFTVLARVDPVAYKLELPNTSKIHSVFHISILKPYHGNDTAISHPLPELSVDNHPLLLPVAICDTLIVLQ